MTQLAMIQPDDLHFVAVTPKGLPFNHTDRQITNTRKLSVVPRLCSIIKRGRNRRSGTPLLLHRFRHQMMLRQQSSLLASLEALQKKTDRVLCHSRQEQPPPTHFDSRRRPHNYSEGKQVFVHSSYASSAESGVHSFLP